jgi:putative SOS response-associated peptidase YedK
VPFWLKPDQLGKQPYSTINARADRVQTAPTYREPFKKRRCLVPASGWYEWQKIDAKTKKPHYFHQRQSPLRSLACGMSGTVTASRLPGSEQSSSAGGGATLV